MLVMEGWVINEGMSLLLHVLERERERDQRLEEELEQTAALLQGSPKECDPHREQLQGLDGPEGRPRALLYTRTCTAVLVDRRVAEAWNTFIAFMFDHD